MRRLRRSPTAGAVVLTAVLAASTSAQDRPVLAPAVQAAVAVDAPVIALTNVRLVDGTGAPVRDDHTIVITGVRITAVGAAAEVAVPAGAHVLDLRGHTVIPGLIGLHEHTYFAGLGTPPVPMVSAAPLFLALGVTTAMTAGSQLPYPELNLKLLIDSGRVAGPRLHIAGPYLTGVPTRPGFQRFLRSPADVRRVVNYWADEGATWFKILDGPTWVVRETIAAAHARGLKVTAHLCSVTFSEAAALGIDALQHGFITNSEYVPGKEPDVCPPENQRAQADVDVASEAVQQSIRRIVAHGTPVVSTLAVYETFIPGRARLDPRALELVEPGVRARMQSFHADLAQDAFAMPERLLTKMMEWERAFVGAGGLLGAGSDPWGSGLLAGYGNLRNFELLVEAGFTPEQAVQIVTLNGARILGDDVRLGSVAAGKIADLIVIRGDPVRKPADIYEVVTVFKDGVGYDSAKLRDMARGGIGVR